MVGEGGELYRGPLDIDWKRQRGQSIRVLVTYALLILGAFVFLLPLFWMVTTSLKTQAEVYVFPPTFFPDTFRWENFPEGWTYQGMQWTRWLINTLTITLAVMVGTVLSATLCGYGFARLSFPGRDIWFIMVLASIMLPGTVTLIPLFVGYHRIGWLDTFLPLTVPAFFGGGAFNIFLMRQFLKGIPIEIEEAAIVDGASRFRILWQIFVPLSRPVIATIAVFTFQGVWNDYFGPLIFLTSQDKYTLALGITFFKGLYSTQIPYMMAMSFLMVIPMIVVFFFAQKLMIRGVILTGIKG
jgi:multiple sugar transport system permease protein